MSNEDEAVEGDDLASIGYRQTESECHEDDCEGKIWYDDHTLVCGSCSSAVDLDQRRRSVTLDDPWDRYRSDRPTYENSGRARMPGGFLSAYDWVSSDDIDGMVSSVSADSFYR